MRKIIAVFSVMALAGCSSSPPLNSVPGAAFPVFFQTWSAAIDENASTTIETAAKAASVTPDAAVTVTGAADTVGSEQANVYISETRAQVVADALIADGVASSRIIIKGIGAQNAPGMESGTPAQFSRRVLIQIGG